MKCLHLLVLLVGLVAGAPVAAAETREQAASELLDAMSMDATFDKLIVAALEAQVAAQPKLAPYEGVMRAFASKYMSYAVLRPELAAVYAEEFSLEELSEATKFYSTPTGKKMVEKLPGLYKRGSEIGEEAIQAHISELSEMIEAERRRIEEAKESTKKVEG
jgi:hypothetical protein